MVTTLTKIVPITRVSNETLGLLIKLLEQRYGIFNDYRSLTTALNSSFNISITEEEVLEYYRLGIEIEDLELTIKNCQVL